MCLKSFTLTIVVIVLELAVLSVGVASSAPSSSGLESSSTLRFNESILMRRKRWGEWGHGGGNGGWNNGYGRPPNFVPYVPNNNLAVGYPTAYGLGMGYVRPGGHGETQPPKAFSVRCTNGGAHIGQCRLDEDAICVALGGTCINGICCTTPFINIGLQLTSTTTQTSLIVDGDSIQPRLDSEEESSRESERGEREHHRGIEVGSAETTEEERVREIAELNKLLELGKKSGMSTDSPIYAVFGSVFERHTTPNTPHRRTYATVTPEWTETSPQSTTEMPSTTPTATPTTITTKTATVRWTRRRPSTTTAVPTTPVNSVETDNSDESGDALDPDDYTKKKCSDGSAPIGPCNEDDSCPLDHTCQRGRVCCYDLSLVLLIQQQKWNPIWE